MDLDIVLKTQGELHLVFTTFCSQVQNENGLTIIIIRSDHDGEFENKLFEIVFDQNDISHYFSCPRTLQKNGFVERKNRTLQEMAKIMINGTNVAKHLWAEAVNTTYYIQNMITIVLILGKTPYKPWKNKKPNIAYFNPFGCTYFIRNTKDNLNKVDSKAKKCIMLGFSECSKGYKVYNTETSIV